MRARRRCGGAPLEGCRLPRVGARHAAVLQAREQVDDEKDLKEGWILTCVSYAETDVEIEC